MGRHVPGSARELDISRWRLSSVTDFEKVAERMSAIPGFRPSAAFFLSLRANLVLPPTHSAMSSSPSTPLLTPSSSSILPAPSPSDLPTSDPTSASDLLAEIPSLSTSVLTEESDITAALKLTADSIAQQRQAASRALILSPAFVLLWSVLIGILYKYTYHNINDIGMMLTTGGGLTMAMLAACKMLSGPYLVEAEKINFGFLNAEDGEEDTVIGTKFGDEVIGTCIVRFYRPASSMVGKKKGKNIKLQAPAAALIRAWTVRLKYRHKGVGTGLLEEAVKLAKEKGGKDVKIGFAKDHANSRMVVPEMFNGGFRRGQEQAVALLEKVEREIESSGNGGRRR